MFSLQTNRQFILFFIALFIVLPAFALDESTGVLHSYMGREIADTMHYTGAEWLTRETREREESTSKLIEALQIKPEQIICDLGCGNGYYTLPLAKLTGPEGKVYAVDIQPEMLAMLKDRVELEDVNNIEYILATETDPKLPKQCFDLVLLVDVYHEFSDPETMLNAIRESLKPDGRVALVEYRAEDPDVPIKPLHKMSKAQILKEWRPNGFTLSSQFDDLPWQHLMFFQCAAGQVNSTTDTIGR